MRNFVILFTAFNVLFTFNARGFDLNCDFNYGSWSFVGSVRTCQVRNLIITSRNQTVTSVNGEIDRNENIEAIEISYQSIKYMLRDIDKFFPDLKAIKIYGSKLEYIDQDDLKPFQNLKELSLGNNFLSVLESDLFEFNSELRYIEFDNNALTFVGENLLEPLKTIQQASFRSCSCVSDYDTSYQSIQASLKNSIRRGCKSLEEFKPFLCRKEINKLNANISDLQSENQNLKDQMKQLNSLLKSSEGNLESATRNLLVATKLIDLTSDQEVSLSNEEKVVVTCATLHNDTCITSNFVIKVANTTIEAVKDNEGNEIVANTIRNLTIDAQQSLFLPTNLDVVFTQLVELSVTRSGLFRISYEIFGGLENLITLNLRYNKVLEITSDAFDSSTKLFKLDLSHNKLDSLESGVFKALENLQIIKLNNNLLFMISVETFENLKNLQILSLQNNKLKFISATLLTPLVKVQVVDFSSNICINMRHPNETLTQMTSTIIDNCIAPIELNCNFEEETVENSSVSPSYVCKALNLKINYPKTKISKVIGNSLSDFDTKNLTTFVARSQSLKFLPFELAKTFPNLENILIKDSKLTTLHKSDFKGFSNLRSIKIRHNNLSSIEEQVFDEVSQLKFLDLSHNHIHMLPSKIFYHLVQLKTLVLSHNAIEKFAADFLPKRNVIEEVRLNNNQLEMVETKTLRYLRRAERIDLSVNVCIDVKFDRADITSKSLVELSGEIDLNCSDDD